MDKKYISRFFLFFFDFDFNHDFDMLYLTHLVFAHRTCLAHLVLHFSLFYYTFYSFFFTYIYMLLCGVTFI